MVKQPRLRAKPLPPPGRTLDEYAWAEIRQIADAGLAPRYFKVGDIKSIYLQGTVGTRQLDFISSVRILGFNHRGVANTIDFGCFSEADDNGALLDFAMADMAYNTNSILGDKCFNMNHWGEGKPCNYGGWKGCDLRYDILGSVDRAPSGYGKPLSTSRVGFNATASTATNPVSNTLMAALPADLRAVMKPMTIYTDNYGNISNVSAHVTASVDYLPLLAEYEVLGKRTGANQYEREKQAQYAYFRQGNSPIKYASVSTPIKYVLRSPVYGLDSSFVSVDETGAAAPVIAFCSLALAPIFRV